MSHWKLSPKVLHRCQVQKRKSKKGGLEQTLQGEQTTGRDRNTPTPTREDGKEGTAEAASHYGSVQRKGATITPSKRKWANIATATQQVSWWENALDGEWRAISNGAPKPSWKSKTGRWRHAFCARNCCSRDWFQKPCKISGWIWSFRV